MVKQHFSSASLGPNPVLTPSGPNGKPIIKTVSTPVTQVLHEKKNDKDLSGITSSKSVIISELKPITFRVKPETYEKLHDFSHWNNVHITRLLDIIADEYFENWDINPRPTDNIAFLKNKDPNFVGCRRKVK